MSDDSLKNMTTGIHRHTHRYAFIIVTATALAYSNTFQVPFIFDDVINIIKNHSIRGIPSVLHAFFPSAGIAIAGRPLINFTLAVNYAISGLAPWSYHLFNLLVHISAALVLFGVVRRTFLFRNFQMRSHDQATKVAFASALIWSLHPLQTQAVTYTIQRCESLMGLCFLLVFYFAIRGWQSEKQTAWHLAAVLAFLLGVGTKEVIIVAPVLLFYFDYLFVNQSPRLALKQSRLLYTGLATGIILMACLVMAGGTMSSMAGARVYSAFDYWRTQLQVTLHYIRLAFWPSHLSLDYDWQAASWGDAWPALLMFTAFVGFTFWSIFKRQPLSFAAVWFLLILSPTIIVHLPDMAFEHRMYLPLAAIIVPSVILVFHANRIFLIRLNARRKNPWAGSQRWIWYLFLLISLSLSILTYSRNRDYRNNISIWQDAALKYPRNSRAHANLGEALFKKGYYISALSSLNAAIRIEKENAKTYSKAAASHSKTDDLYLKYLIIRGIYVEVENNLGLVYISQGEVETALSHFQAALMVEPNHVATLSNTGLAYISQGRFLAATKAFEKAIKAGPNSPNAYVNMGALMRQSGKPGAAIKFLTAALHLRPEHVEAHYHMGMALFEVGQESEAISFLEKALRLDPDFRLARDALKSVQSSEESTRGTT